LNLNKELKVFEKNLRLGRTEIGGEMKGKEGGVRGGGKGRGGGMRELQEKGISPKELDIQKLRDELRYLYELVRQR